MRGRKAILYLAILTALLTLACLPLLLHGPQLGHSLKHNLSWSNAFTAQLAQGELYPRWLLNGYAGAGSPVFFFYAPLPFYFTALGSLVCRNCSVAVQLGIGEWLLILCSGFSFYCFARQYAIPLFATIGAVLYALAPYHFAIDLLERQAIGEIAVYIWMPLILLSIARMAQGKGAVTGLAVSYALLLVSHLPCALLFSLLLPPYVLLIKYYTSRPRLISMSLAGITLGIMLAAVYLLPALLTQGNISSYKWWGPHFHYDRWFFLDGIEAPSPHFSLRLFGALSASTLAFIPAWIVAYRYHPVQHRPLLAALLFFFAAAWFMMLPGSRFVWELVPFLPKVQFPWRLMVIVDFAVAATLVLALQSLRDASARRLVLIPAAACVLFLAKSADLSAEDYAAQWKLLADADRQALLQTAIATGHGPKEYLPSRVQLQRDELMEAVRDLERVAIDPAAGEARVTRWQARDIRLEVSLNRETGLQVRQFHYPGWVATLDREEIRLPVEAAGPAGLLRLRVPPGHHHIHLQLQPLWREAAGVVISVTGLLLLIIVQVGRWRRAEGTARNTRNQRCRAPQDGYRHCAHSQRPGT
jgi:hypothetical protein